MSKKKATLILLPLLLLCIAGGVYLLRDAILYRPLKRVIEREAARKIGVQAQIEEVSGDLFSNLKLSEVEVLDIVDLPPGSSLRFESLKVRYSALRLATGGEDWLEGIEIVRPVVRIDLRGESRELPGLAREEDVEKARAIRLPNAAIRDGVVEILHPRGEASIRGLDLHMESEGASSSGEVRAAEVRVRVDGEERRLRGIALSLRIEGDRIDVTDVTFGDLPYRLAASAEISRREEGVIPVRVEGAGGGRIEGEVTVGDGPVGWSADLEIAEIDIGPILDLLLGPERAQGTFGVSGAVRGTGTEITGRLNFRAAGGSVVDPISARAQGSLAFESGTVLLEGVTVDADGVGLLVDGSVGRGGSVDLAWRVEVTEPEGILGRWLPEVRGEAVCDGRVAGTLRSPRLVGDLRLTGEVPGRLAPVECSGRFGFGDGILLAEGMSIRSGEGRARLDARVRLEEEPVFLCEFSGAAGSISEAWGWFADGDPPIGGAVSVKGALAGTPSRPGGWVEFEAEAGGGEGFTVDRISGRLRVEGRRLSVDSVRAWLGGGRGEAAIDGRIEFLPEGAARGEVTRLEARWDGIDLVGRTPLPLLSDGGAVEIPGWTLESAAGKVGLSGRRTGDGHLDLDLDLPSLALGEALRPLGLDPPPSGEVRVEAKLSGAPGDVVGTARVDLADISWQGVAGWDGVARLRWEGGVLTIEDARLGGADGAGIWARGDVPTGEDDPIDLLLEARGIDLAPLAAPLDWIRLPRGRVRGQVLATGTGRDPILHGFVLLEDGGARFPRPIPALEDLSGRVVLGGRRHELTLTARLGKEEARLEGAVEMAGLDPAAIDLSLRGRNILVAGGRDVRARSDVDLRFERRKGAMRLTGDLHLRRLRYYSDFATGAAAAPAGGGEEAGLAGIGPIDLDVAIESEDEVWIDNRETLSRYRLEAHLGGTTKRPVVRGTVKCVRGVYRYSGRTFQIDSALLDFDGEDLENPRVEISARTRVGGVSVFLTVHGRVRSPDIELASDPPYPKADILSLLSVGYTRSGAAAAGGITLGLTRVTDWILGFVGEIFRTRDRDFSFTDSLSVEGSPGEEGIDSSEVKVSYEISEHVTAQAERDRYGYFNFDLFLLRLRF